MEKFESTNEKIAESARECPDWKAAWDNAWDNAWNNAWDNAWNNAMPSIEGKKGREAFVRALKSDELKQKLANLSGGRSVAVSVSTASDGRREVAVAAIRQTA